MSSTTTLILRARLFEFYAKHLWQFHRYFVRQYLHKRCLRCSVSEACLKLDSNGLCSQCRSFSESTNNKSSQSDSLLEGLDKELDELLRQHVGKGELAYDALVLFSGGKDSTFLIYEMQRRYPGLRILALLVDHNFVSPIALTNAAEAAKKLDVDYVIIKPALSLCKQAFRLACTLLEGKGCLETVDQASVYLFVSLAKTYAATNKIPLLVSGLNWAQLNVVLGNQSFESPLDHDLTLRGSNLKEILHRINDLDKYLWHPDKFPKENWPRFIHPFFVWRQREEDVRETVTKLGFIKAGMDSPLLTNDLVIILMVVCDYVRLGYCSYEPDITNQVREGTADRIYWRNVFEMLEYSAKTGWFIDKEIDNILDSLDLSRADVGLVARTQ